MAFMLWPASMKQFRLFAVLLQTTAGIFGCTWAKAQSDTLTLSITQVEKRFLDSNLQLLAAHYNINAQAALIQQAKLWNNPVLNTDQVIAADGHFFPYHKNPDGTYSGQYFIQLQQLILTARKRGKLIDMATTNKTISEWQLQDLLRNLRSQLRTDYFNLAQQLQNKSLLETQQLHLQQLLAAMQEQLNSGNIAQKEFLRIQALLISLQQDITDINKSITDTQADLKTLLSLKDNSFIRPDANPFMASVLPPDSTQTLFALGRQHNPYYRLQEAQTLYQQQNLRYQKALRVPDITLGPNFDRNSNFVQNYIGLGISFPLPVFNKNQGNIKSAEYSIQQQQALTKDAETDLYNNIDNARNKLQLSILQNNQTQKEFYSRYQLLYENMLSSYRQKQISLLEFLDFFNDYTSLWQRLTQQQLNLQLCKDALNYAVGTDVIQ